MDAIPYGDWQLVEFGDYAGRVQISCVNPRCALLTFCECVDRTGVAAGQCHACRTGFTVQLEHWLRDTSGITPAPYEDPRLHTEGT